MARISVGGNGISDDGLNQLARLQQLIGLELRDTAITDCGLERLLGDSLANIHLSGAAIDDRTLEPLARMRQLVELSLTDTSVTEAGTTRLRAANRRLKVRTATGTRSAL